MKYVFDLDGTLCSNSNGNYHDCEPIEKRIKIVNELFDEGHEITIYTARGMGSCNNNPIKAQEKYYSLTQKQLEKWGLKYHNLFLGKPAADIYVDDKGVNDEDYFGTKIRT